MPGKTPIESSTFDNRIAGQNRSEEMTLNDDDQFAIISDQEETLEEREPRLLRGAGPASLDLEDQPGEFVRGDIDLKTQMDRTLRATRASAQGHRDLDDSSETTPGGLEEVAASTDRAIGHLSRRKSVAPPEDTPSSMREVDESIDADQIASELSLAAEQMNEGDSTEQEEAEPLEGDETGALTDVGAGRSSVIRHH